MDVILGAVIGPIGLGLFVVFCGLLLKGFDRKIAAHMQRRVGPPIIQPFRDVSKFMIKDTVQPERAMSWLYNGAPIISLASVITLLLYLPFGNVPFTPVLSGQGDVILVLYILLIPGLSVTLGGFASSSRLATVGAQRKMITMMSYEFPLAVVIISIAWKLNQLYPLQSVFSLGFISSHPLWGEMGLLGNIGMLLLLMSLMVVTPGQAGTIPFDVCEASSEIAEGALTDYSGRNFALFYLSDAVKTVAVGTLTIALFFPYDICPIIGIEGRDALALDFCFFFVKLFLVVILMVTLPRTATARLKITQIPMSYWVIANAMAVVGLVFIVLG
ncbi:MAG: complex I subunit 1 family protein [Thermodesulfobacteriota bacterium]|nr:complex I subunit 1 family protein [Thermodesulfobacteriota bacterium]